MRASGGNGDTVEAKEWLVSLIGNAPFGILALDLEGYCTLANARAAEALDMPTGELVDREFAELLALWPELAEQMPAVRRSGQESGRANFDCVRVVRGQRTYTVRGRVIVDGLLLTLNDITEDVRIRERQERLLAELRSANRELAEFAYICAHDMKSPVSSITGLLEAIEDCDDLPEALPIVELTRRSATKLDRTVRSLNEVLSLRQTIGAEAEPVRVRDVLEEVLDSLAGEIENASATVRVESADDVEVAVQPVHLGSVLQNLVGNAVKYRAECRAPEVVVRIAAAEREGGRMALIDVEDNGTGFDVERAGERLFGLFNRFHSHVEGSGIGLYLAKSIVDSHRGTIDVDSTEGVGTRFRVELPAAAGGLENAA